MSSERWVARIRDILDAIIEIQSFTRKMDYAEFSADQRTMRAVEMALVIIGEAANQVPEEIQNTYPAVPWPMLRAMRNRLVHAYFSVDPRILWETIQDDLPGLQKAVQHLLDGLDS